MFVNMPTNLFINNAQGLTLLPCFNKKVFASITVHDVALLDTLSSLILFGVLKDSGSIKVVTKLASGETNNELYPSAEEITQKVKKYLGSWVTNLQVEKEYIVANKATWDSKGASLKERREKKAEAKPANPWADKAVQDTEMINEDDLLAEESKIGAPVKTFASESDCVTKPKACENCSCGRKEAEDGVEMSDAKKKDLENGNVKSSCGKCYLGDAFRCASCPYLGQPAFEAGDKVTLKTESQAKIQSEVEANTTKVQGTKVILDL
jgi:hypothetical protein